MIAWTEGRFIDPHSPLVGASDPGLMTGQGMFDTIAAYHGRLWALEAHLSRLSASLTAAHIPQPQVDLDEGARLVAAHLRNVPVGRIRITVLNTHEGSRTVITATPEPHAPALGAPHPTDARVAITPWARSPSCRLLDTNPPPTRTTFKPCTGHTHREPMKGYGTDPMGALRGVGVQPPHRC